MRGADTGDGGERVREVLSVVGLEDAEGVDGAPCVEDDEVRDEGLGPGLPRYISSKSISYSWILEMGFESSAYQPPSGGGARPSEVPPFVMTAGSLGTSSGYFSVAEEESELSSLDFMSREVPLPASMLVAQDA